MTTVVSKTTVVFKSIISALSIYYNFSEICDLVKKMPDGPAFGGINSIGNMMDYIGALLIYCPMV